MKPKSQTEKRLCDLALKLPKLPKRLVEEGFKQFSDCGYTIPRRGRKVEVWCQCCGHRELTRGTLVELIDYVCPACGRKLKLSQYPSKDSAYHAESRWQTYIDRCQGMQVARTFEFIRSNRDDQPTKFSVCELFQNWAAPNGREVITSRPYTRSIYGERFDTSKPFWIAKHNASYTGQYAFEDTFDIAVCHTFFSARLLPELKRDGFTRPFISECCFKGVNYIKVAARMQSDKSFMTAIKTGYKDLALYISERDVKFPTHIFRIMHRNHYMPKDIAMFCDYIDNCVFCGVDTHNAFYVCPKNLREAHQRIMRKKGKIEGERKLQCKRQQVEKDEPQYQKMRAAFLELEFVRDDIRVFTAPSVAEVLLEGCAMHHCVFDNGYYKNESSLIMFARNVNTGARLETVEVNLRNFSIAQSRGLQNQLTPWHNDIVTLVASNMDQIRSAAKRRNMQH